MVATMTCVTLLLFGTVVYAASYVQGWVGNRPTTTVANASCNGATATRALTPGGVTVNVYNSTDHTGLAATAASSLQKQGFKVATIDNDPLGKALLGIGEIRHGPTGLEGATLAAKRLPGANVVQDDRMDASVDVVLGKTFKSVKVPPKAVASKTAKTTPHC
jgi:LytR cell envelope-related transcriptional attenuator